MWMKLICEGRPVLPRRILGTAILDVGLWCLEVQPDANVQNQSLTAIRVVMLLYTCRYWISRRGTAGPKNFGLNRSIQHP